MNATGGQDSARPAKKLLFVIPEDWFFWSHRRALAAAAQAAGYEVSVATRVTNHGERIAGMGIHVFGLQARRSSRNPLAELRAIYELIQLYRRERPTVVHHTAVKQVLYGSVAAWIAGVPCVVNGIPGLGEIFIAKGWRAGIRKWLVTVAYRCALALNRRRSRVVFENPDDRDRFVRDKVVDPTICRVILGMGCDTTEFVPTPEPTGQAVVMYAGRMLWSKGVEDLVRAGAAIRREGLDCRVVLVGEPDDDNPQSIPRLTLERMAADGHAEWWGRREDMANVLEQANLLVLPSRYGEGLPKILMEAAAASRALIASDIPGCREIVRPGENGLLVPPGDVPALAHAIGQLLVDSGRRARMGERGRRLVLDGFSDSHVNAQTLKLYDELMRRQLA